jgi:hypothetical protein
MFSINNSGRNNVADFVIILGNPDPEMEMIKNLAEKAGFLVIWEKDINPDQENWENKIAVFIEPTRKELISCVRCGEIASGDCNGLAISDEKYPGGLGPCGDLHCWAIGDLCGPIIIDHHNPNDRGYSYPAVDFLYGSSIGQFIRFLAELDALPEMYFPSADIKELETIPVGTFLYRKIGTKYNGVSEWFIRSYDGWRKISKDILVIAAADHCLNDAYQGKCPGISKLEVLGFRVKTKAAFKKVSILKIEEDIEKAVLKLANAKYLQYGDEIIPVKDLRGEEIPELPEAAAYYNMPFVANIGKKVVLQCAPYEIVEFFIETWGPENGLKNIYGNPNRGFAGGFLE